MVAVIFACEVRAASRFPGNAERAEDFGVELTILYGLSDESTRTNPRPRTGSVARTPKSTPPTSRHRHGPGPLGTSDLLVEYLTPGRPGGRSNGKGGSPVGLALNAATFSGPKTLFGTILTCPQSRGLRRTLGKSWRAR